MGEEVRKVACWFCYQNCGVLVRVKDGKITSVEGDVEHPVSFGARCPRNFAWKEFLHHPDRVNFPLKRTGKKGENRWEKVSWEQALDEIALKLRQIREECGAEAVASAGGTNRTDDWARRRFFNLFGSPNIFHIAPVCGLNGFVIEAAVYGWGTSADLQGSKTIVMWGHNAAVSCLPMMRGVLDAIEEGAKLVVIDPRFTESASKADIWLQIRPGSDGALGLAWLNVIINEKLYDTQFVEKYTVGFEELKERVQQYTPDWAEKVTWVPKEKLVEAARLYATNKPSCMLWGAALDHIGINAGEVVFTKALLRAVTGNLDIQGGNVITGPYPSFVTDEELELNDMLPSEQRRKQIGSERFRLMGWPGYEILSAQSRKFWGKAMCAEWTCGAHPPSVWRAIISGKPYPVKGLVVLADNPTISYSNSKLVYEALKTENLSLLVVMDYWVTPTAVLADYVLPAASWMERPVITSYFGLTNWFIASERAIDPLYERKTDFWFWRELGLRLGQTGYWPWKSLEEVNSRRVEPLGYEDYEKFVRQVRMHIAPMEYRAYEKRGFGTPSGKVELYSSVLKKLGYDPLPYYEEPTESPYRTPELYEKYPLILISGNFMPYHHSELRQISLLRRMAPEPQVEIHPHTAGKLGIGEEDWVYVETQTGKVKMKAKLTIGIDPRVVFAQKGWWFPEEPSGEPILHGLWKSNINVCTADGDEYCDPICGSWNYKALLCRVYLAFD